MHILYDTTLVTTDNNLELDELISDHIKDAKLDNLVVFDIKYSTAIKQQGILITHFNAYENFQKANTNIIEYSALLLFTKLNN